MVTMLSCVGKITHSTSLSVLNFVKIHLVLFWMVKDQLQYIPYFFFEHSEAGVDGAGEDATNLVKMQVWRCTRLGNTLDLAGSFTVVFVERSWNTLQALITVDRLPPGELSAVDI